MGVAKTARGSGSNFRLSISDPKAERRTHPERIESQLRDDLENHPAPTATRSAAGGSARLGCAVEVAGLINGQACGRKVAVSSVTGKAVKDCFGAGVGQLEYCAQIERTSIKCRAIKIILLVENQARVGRNSIYSATKAVEYGLSARCGHLKDRADASFAAILGCAIEVTFRIKNHTPIRIEAILAVRSKAVENRLHTGRSHLEHRPEPGSATVHCRSVEVSLFVEHHTRKGVRPIGALRHTEQKL